EAASALNLLIALSALGASLLQASRGQAIDSLALCMALLIALLGWVIVRYSRRYLAGEEHQERYAGAMLFTLAAVCVVVITQNFAALVAGWIASSLGLHQLLIFFRERAAAQIVAHKKFLASRLAETCLVAAAALLFIELNTLSLPAMKTELSNALQLSWPVQIAALLIALGVILKSAQLPVHGWLIQVMEAPTPVSALLHAGIVNLGGFALIRLAALISAVPAAQILLVLVGGLTAVLAGLVMMTRISIKVRLAWSTCAQMGFMLMECGLGLYDLALLHLLAHSLYKAYAFLSAGDTVLDYRRRRLLPLEVAHPRSAWPQWLAAPASLLLVLLSQATWREFGVHLELASAAQLILAIGLAPLLWLPAQRLLHGSVAVIGLVQLYFGWHLLFGALVAQPAVATPLSLTIWICGLFSAFFTVQVWLRAHPHGRLAQLLYPWVYSGFYLDERFTRLTFQLWPARIERKASARELHPASHNPYPVSHHPFGGESA
ncbi:MAG TPA: NADH-quinone oxidoreductase subunit L, partial [Spongiibacteraceae bacterium]|nr:NADH-quinone oxidoreductase subunit L [Spongiibacteraceae bacterium]